ncbi:hypothetical protein GYMLUDRAFT_260842 [Collybiopsis luxurians FD-317 M1]|uniref:Rhodopsin domain-containing protein n=1 Tax=Collybiopsis luxurians FD-317 M1 TaxID=944289 RepID=A0A0D0CQI6_9AGAR|nr:hypothetical protein GYMLUDRAFT_260842 [Collybiopsis luxurians FD-317 M1]
MGFIVKSQQSYKYLACQVIAPNLHTITKTDANMPNAAKCDSKTMVIASQVGRIGQRIGALLATVFTIVMNVGALLLDENLVAPAKDNTRQVKIIRSWITLVTYSFGVWCARITLILSIVRVIPTFFTLRKISEVAAVCFFLMGMSLFIPSIYFCVSDRSWYDWPEVVCPLSGNPKLAISQLIMSLLGEATLVIIPLRLFCQIGLASDKRRMLAIMFSATLITMVISILHAVFLVASAWNLAAFAVEVQMSTALIVANLAILTPYIYRLVKHEGDFDSEPCTHYRSFEPDGVFRMRRVSDLAPDVRLTDTTRLSTLSTGHNASDPAISTCAVALSRSNGE